MSKPAAGLYEIDFAKAMDMSKMFADFKLPLFNVEALLAAHRRNIETCTALNQAAMESWQALLRRQAEIMRQNMEDATGLMNAMMASPSPEDKMLRHAEASKQAVEKAMANAREIADTVTKANQRAMETVSSRLSESIDELRGMMKTNASKVASAA